MTTDSSSSRRFIVTPIGSASTPPGVKWMPFSGAETEGLLGRNSKLDQSARKALLVSSAEILGSGVDPQTLKGSTTGLVVGQVQSGKTLSFTTVVALARDNAFPLVILIAGNKDVLLTQSHERLADDLDVSGGEGLPAWKMKKNIRSTDAFDEQLLRQTISSWSNDALDADERSTLILTVLKQNQRLQSLTTLLRKVDLSRTPVLVIDDEADRASLNTAVNSGTESTTYTRIRALRAALPLHTYLQYTATPQAPLLINIADTLSPDLVRVLEPGSDYVGGKDFFAPGSPHVVEIPASEVLASGSFPADPPRSLLEALRIFFIGLASANKRRSMLIHPSRLRADHRTVLHWVDEVKSAWLRILQLSQGDPDRQDLVTDFRGSYQDLKATCTDLPPFDHILEKLPKALRTTSSIEFNTNGRPKTPEIKWRDALGWILVGGQAVDRGFTVDSLTVTYMPRGVGGGNADALQQRARFFGYKRQYLGLCRVYLESDTRVAFENYVEHEEIMRTELRRLANTGESLKSWRRRLVLSPDLHPCRNSVISDDVVRAQRGTSWIQQRGALMTPEARAENRALVDTFTAGLSLHLDEITFPSPQAAQQHLVAPDVQLSSVVDMLVDYKLEYARDSAVFTGVLVTLGEALQHDPLARATVYVMRPGVSGQRTVSAEGNLEAGFLQGRTGLTGGATAYPGDDVFKSERNVTLQIHSYDLTEVRGGPPVASDAPLLAIYVPKALTKAWLVQVQRGQAAA